MNRETKRRMAKSGVNPETGQRASGTRPAPTAPEKRERVGPGQFLSEVRGELKKVAWPTRPEVVNSTIIVLIAVVFMTALIFAFDFVSAKTVLFLFDN